MSAIIDELIDPLPAAATIPPFDIDNPQAEEGYGSVTQDVIARSLLGSKTSSSEPERERYYRKAARSLPLSMLQSLYNGGEGAKAFSLLKRKLALSVDVDMYEPGGSPRFTHMMAGHHIDFSLKVPDRVGFDTILPTTRAHTSWCFNLNLCGSVREFLNHRGDLGFDPTARMLHIGTQDHDNVYLAMAPKASWMAPMTQLHQAHILGLPS
ncbi:uncharacterized protein EI90DRAFT_3139119 [Cantharellus anzutake]|uniref:uncharacterized protein n=1 Tax=Cantharellus anzutake TaxID=1750568 RepID=UPI0019049BCD|nr:uncharacterized protein EI90DRAFT_3139119 [Cantharellus anzutake]KAF8310813.1 hypothetical protein EI90DRAFT_3139119 [Cantharellus anzutake]